MYRCAAARDGAAACWRSASVGAPRVLALLPRVRLRVRLSHLVSATSCTDTNNIASGAWPKGNSRVFTASQCDLSVSQDFARIDSLIFIWVEGGSGIG